MSYLKTLLVGGTDLRGLTGVRVLHMDLYAPATRRGSNDTIPGRRGQIGAPLPIDAYGFTVGVRISGSDEAVFTTNLAALGAVVLGTNGLVTLERRLPASGGSPYKAMTAAGQFVGGLNPTMDPGLLAGTTELQFINLDGAWWDSGSSTWNVP